MKKNQNILVLIAVLVAMIAFALYQWKLKPKPLPGVEVNLVNTTEDNVEVDSIKFANLTFTFTYLIQSGSLASGTRSYVIINGQTRKPLSGDGTTSYQTAIDCNGDTCFAHVFTLKQPATNPATDTVGSEKRYEVIPDCSQTYFYKLPQGIYWYRSGDFIRPKVTQPTPGNYQQVVMWPPTFRY